MQGEGYHPPGTQWRASAAKVCTSAARKTVGRPLARARGGASQEGLVSLPGAEREGCFSVVALGEGVAGRNGPLRRVAEDAQAAGDREEWKPSLRKTKRLSFNGVAVL